MQQIFFRNGRNTIITQGLEVEFSSETVGLTHSNDYQVRGPGAAHQKKDDEKGSDKLDLPIPEVHMLHPKRDEKNADNQTAESENP